MGSHMEFFYNKQSQVSKFQIKCTFNAPNTLAHERKINNQLEYQHVHVRKKRQIMIFTNVFLEQLIVLEQVLLSTHDSTQSKQRQQTPFIFSENGELTGLIIKERRGKKILQGVNELGASGKMTVTKVNTITLNRCIEQRVVVHYGLNF